MVSLFDSEKIKETVKLGSWVYCGNIYLSEDVYKKSEKESGRKKMDTKTVIENERDII